MKRLSDKELASKKYGRLTFLARAENRGRKTFLRCQCDCGKVIEADMSNIRNGNTSSCGCFDKEQKSERAKVLAPIIGKLNATHGKSKTKTYIAWIDAKKRCHSPKNQSYPYYGARGIAMCDEWRVSFEAFLGYMGECPAGLTLERLDNEKGYEPGNCVWADKCHQSRNRRSNKLDMKKAEEIRERFAKGESTAALAKEYGICWSSAKNVISKVTWY